MIDIAVPGSTAFRFEHLVLDYNGTLARDGKLLPGVITRLRELSRHLRIHILTADTFGSARKALSDIPCDVTIVAPDEQPQAKLRFVEQFVPAHTIAIGNGRNDALMLEAATLGIAVIGLEGTATEALAAAHVVVPDICAALDLFVHPLRLVATLRT
jgi:P-type E1-E2 ATPase